MKNSSIKKLLWVILVSVLLNGCFETKLQKEVHDVQWFMNHKLEHREMLNHCANNPGELRNSPNCINAQAALKKLSGGKLRRFKRE